MGPNYHDRRGRSDKKLAFREQIEALDLQIKRIQERRDLFVRARGADPSWIAIGVVSKLVDDLKNALHD